MTGRESSFGDQLLNIRGKLEQANQVGDGGPIFAGAAADLLVVQLQLAGQPVKGQSCFDGVQILPLDVLYEGDLEEPVVRDFLNDAGTRAMPAIFAARQRRSPATN